MLGQTPDDVTSLISHNFHENIEVHQTLIDLEESKTPQEKFMMQAIFQRIFCARGQLPEDQKGTSEEERAAARTLSSWQPYQLLPQGQVVWTCTGASTSRDELTVDFSWWRDHFGLGNALSTGLGRGDLRARYDGQAHEVLDSASPPGANNC